jgi:transcription initiation factor TFIIIB Brf1 subunit/transcription initiation factor TFIIB
MKCPKCGSERICDILVLKVKNGYVPQHVCMDCKTHIKKYQTRLDKLLEKFEDEEENNIKYIDFGNHVDLVYYDNTFSIGNYKWVYHEDRQEISLETVESLIKDLEEE